MKRTGEEEERETGTEIYGVMLYCFVSCCAYVTDKTSHKYDMAATS